MTSTSRIPHTLMQRIVPFWTNSDCVILFGSRANGCATDHSDFDILCIGPGSRCTVRSVDMVWVSRTQVCSHGWLGSELAGHVAKYGKVLVGEAHWMNSVFVSEAAIDRKTRAVATRLKVLSALGDRFGTVRRRMYTMRVRRDLQRLRLLIAGLAVPPSAFLDNEWEEGICTAKMLRQTLREVNVNISEPILSHALVN